MRMISVSLLLRANHRLSALGGALLTSLALGGLTLLPTAPAGAIPPVRPLTGTASSLSPATLQAILSDIPLSSLNAGELAELLAQQPALGTLPSGPLIESMTSSIEALAGGGKTLGDLADPSELLSGVETSLTGLLSPLELLTLLEGGSLSSVLTSGLDTLTPTEMLAGLLGGATQPEEMIGELLASVDQQALGELLGSTLTGAPFVKGTVGDLSTQLGMTAEGFASSLGTTSGQLPASTLALTAPLSNGRLLSVLNGADGLALAVLTPSNEGEGGSGGGSGGGGGAGGTSGSGSGGSSGSGSTPTGTTLNLTMLTSLNNTPNGSPPSIAAQKGHLRILSRWLNGHHVTLLLEAPSAGSLVVRGFHLRTRRARVTHAGGLLERVQLTPLGIASLRHHREHPRVRVLVTFFPKRGPDSSASTTMRLR